VHPADADLHARFAGVSIALGAPRFAGCVSAHRGVAGDFPATLARALVDLPARDLVVDLARLEALIAEVRGQPTGSPPPPAPAVAGWPADAGALRLALHPAARLLAVGYPVHRYLDDLLGGGEPAAPPRQRCWLLVWRRPDRVDTVELGADQHAMLSALAAGEPLAAAVEHGLAAVADPRRTLAGVARWFRDWTADGLLVGPPAQATPSVQ